MFGMETSHLRRVIQLGQKGKMEEFQHAMLLNVPFKYIHLMRGDTGS